MRCVLFYHAISSCWNNGHAHFIRGITRELTKLGHQVVVYEPNLGWSRQNALADGGADVLAEGDRLLPHVEICRYEPEQLDLDAAIDRADLVIVHEWNEPALIAALGARRARGGAFRLIFHDTHHRAVTAPHEVELFDLDGYDAVLAFGNALREIYLARGWAHQAFTWHEAADTALFHPIPDQPKDCDLVWIGNWGDDERSAELREFLIQPAARLGLRTRIHGVRYPQDAQDLLSENGIEFAGWLPNHRVPQVFSRARVTVHIPRGPYTRALPGIPTIRVFEALACGIPLVSSPWRDEEQLFPAGSYLQAADGEQMTTALSRVLRDRELAKELAESGVRVIERAHTCRHRAEQLLSIVASIGLRGSLSPQHSENESVAVP